MGTTNYVVTNNNDNDRENKLNLKYVYFLNFYFARFKILTSKINLAMSFFKVIQQ